MKKRLVGAVLVGVLLLGSLTGCQSVAKSFGGTSTLDLPRGEKLINITWKEDSLWYLTRPMTSDDVAETYEFKESSNLGVLEGKVIIVETK